MLIRHHPYPGKERYFFGRVRAHDTLQHSGIYKEYTVLCQRIVICRFYFKGIRIAQELSGKGENDNFQKKSKVFGLMNCQIIMFEIQSPDGCDIFVRNVKYAVSQIIVQNLFPIFDEKRCMYFYFTDILIACKPKGT